MAGQRNLPSYAEAALRRQIEQDNLTELIDEYTDTEGEFTAEELAAARASLYGTKSSDPPHVA